MQRFAHVHLNPASDPPQAYGAAWDLCEELWARLRAFRSTSAQDPFLTHLARRLESDVLAAAIILWVKSCAEPEP